MTDPAPNDRTALAAVGVAALAVACCVGASLLVTAAGSLAVGARVAVVAAVTLSFVTCAALYVRRRPGTKRPRRPS